MTKVGGFIMSALGLIPVTNGVSAALPTSVYDPAQMSRPNIIFIMCDDMGYGDLGCYGQQLIETPNLYRMAKEGMRFTQAYAGSPVSAPSRASFMTGQHAGHKDGHALVAAHAFHVRAQGVAGQGKNIIFAHGVSSCGKIVVGAIVARKKGGWQAWNVRHVGNGRSLP